MNKAKKILGIIMVLIMVLTIGGAFVCFDDSSTSFAVENNGTESSDDNKESKKGNDQESNEDKSTTHPNENSDADPETDRGTIKVAGTPHEWDNGAAGHGTWEIEDGVMTITGTGKMIDFTSVNDTPWNSEILNIKSVVIEEGITRVGGNSFTRAYNLETIQFPDSIEEIGNDAFKMNYNTNDHLTVIDLSGKENLKKIEKQAFRTIYHLSSVDLSGCKNLTSIADNTTFTECPNIKYLDISDTGLNPTQARYFVGAKDSIEEFYCKNCPNIKPTLDLSEFTKLRILDLTGCDDLTGLKLYNNNNSPLTDLYLPSNIKAANFTCPDISSLTIHFDGNYEQWHNVNGFPYDDGKWGNRKVVFSSQIQITGSNHNILYYKTANNKFDLAQFESLKDAHDNLGELYTAASEESRYSGPVNIEILEEEYDLKEKDNFYWNSNRKVTIEPEGSVDSCVIKPGESGGKYMFSIQNADVTFRNITIDGDSKKGIATLENTGSKLTLDDSANLINGKAANGGAVKIENGTLAVNDGAEIKDCSTTNNGKGGAIYLSDGTLIMEGGRISECSPSSDDDGAVYVDSESAELKFKGSPKITGNKYGNEERNVYIADYSDSMIKATGDLSGAAIGLYITDSNHHKAGDDFGFYTNEELSEKSFIGFINDRTKANGVSLVGWGRKENKKIFWASPVKVKYVEKKGSSYVPMPSLDDTAFILGDDKFYSNEEMMQQATGEKTPPVVSDNCYFRFYGLGSDEDVKEGYDDLSTFYLKQTDQGILYSEDGQGEGQLLNGVSAVYVIYTKEAPDDSAKLSLRNTSLYSFGHIKVKIWDDVPEGETPDPKNATMVVTTASGDLVVASELEVHGEDSVPVVVLKGKGKNFLISGGCTDAEIPPLLELEAIITGSTLNTVYLMDNDIRTFPETGNKTISNKFFSSDAWNTVTFSTSIPKEINVSKIWDNQGISGSSGIDSITVEMIDEEGYEVKVRPEPNKNIPGVSVEDDGSVVLSKVESSWPESWKIYVPEESTKVREHDVPGYINITGDADIDSQGNASITNRKAVCRVEDKLYASLQDAMADIVRKEISPATIEMLVDYSVDETVEIPNGYDITLTTALDVYSGSGEVVTIKRAAGYTDGYLFENEYSSGTFRIKDLILDGDNVQSEKALISNAGSLIIGEGTTGEGTTKETSFKNARSNGNGGVIESSGGSVEISEATSFTGNSADKGGAIYVAGGSLTISEDSSFSNNSATNGGAVYYDSSSKAEIVSALFNDNEASEDGGAIYVKSGTVDLNDTVISDGNAKNGAAVYADGGIISVNDSSLLKDNNASQKGGAVYIHNASLIIATEVSDTAGIRNNTAALGGGIYNYAGTVNIINGKITGNEATNSGQGGAVYVNSGTVKIDAGEISGNRASNGAAVFVNTGRANFTGGTVTANTPSGGGAVGVGADTAKLDFSGDIQIKDNLDANNKQNNVYLDQNTDMVINTTGLGNDAYVGIYVSDEYEETRGKLGCRFGAYSGDANLELFKNDRYEDLVAMPESTSGRIIWGQTLRVQARYLENYTDAIYPPEAGMDPNRIIYPSGGGMASSEDFSPSTSNNAVSTIADGIRTKIKSRPTNTMAFGGAYVLNCKKIYDEQTGYTYEYTYKGGEVTSVNWNYSTDQWVAVQRKGDPIPLVEGELEFDILVIYYAEPAYVSIENNNGDNNTLGISSMTLLDRQVIRNAADEGFGYVVAVNGATQPSLRPIDASDLDSLEDGDSIKLLFPGACGQKYDLSGRFTDQGGVAPAGTINLIQNYNNGNVISDHTRDITMAGFTLGGDGDNYSKTLNNHGGTHEIIVKERKPICKIEYNNQEIIFPTISAAVKYVEDTPGLNKEATIQMLVDYLLPGTDAVTIKNDYDITFTTAKDRRKQYYYKGEGNATISRDIGNTSSFISVQSRGSTGGYNSALTVRELDFDGKNLAGAEDGGAIKAYDCKVTVTDCSFKDFEAANGGAIFVHYNGSAPYSGFTDDAATTTINKCTFTKCTSTVPVGARNGGGAIYSNAKIFNLTGPSEFKDCKTDDQGGAVFHRIEPGYSADTRTYMSGCTFTSCKGAAAGAFESDAQDVSIEDCKFKTCTATDRNGGAVNVFSRGKSDGTEESTVNVKDCTFEDCNVANIGAIGQNKGVYGGALRSAALYTTVTNCTFNKTSSNIGGAISASNSNSNSLTISGCIINDSYANKGGGIHCAAKSLTIQDYTPQGGETVRTSIKNCRTIKVQIGDQNIPANSGGGIHHEKSSESTTSISNCDITGCKSEATNTGAAGMYIRSTSLTITDSKISECEAVGNGGGVYFKSNSGSLIIDSTVISSNKSGKQGGGVYLDGTALTLRNDSMIEHNTITGDNVQDAAGVYVSSGAKLTVGSDDIDIDNSSIYNNTTSGGAASNYKMKTNKGENTPDSVYVLSDLTGTIGVVNAYNQGTKFGDSKNPYPGGFSNKEGEHTFISDTNDLYGIINFADTSGTQIIWVAKPICKLTTADGEPLFYDENLSIQAVYDKLSRGQADKASAFATVGKSDPHLYYKNDEGHPVLYGGDTYCIKMLVEDYTATYRIATTQVAGRKIIFTTAKNNDSQAHPEDSFDYRGKPGTVSKVTRGNMGNNPLVTTNVDLEITELTLDGGSEDEGFSVQGSSRILNIDGGKTVTVSDKATLQNAATTSGGGGAVYINSGTLKMESGSKISNCRTGTGNGGAIFVNNNQQFDFNGGEISNCRTETGYGGAVYINGKASMSGSSTIKNCSAVRGGGVFLVGGKLFDMNGGRITDNTASQAGGGIAFGGTGARIYFRNNVTVKNNHKSNGETCNVELDYDSNVIINTDGLTGGYIGVYVPKTLIPKTDKTYYDKHGDLGTPFGKYANTSQQSLKTFVNDIAGYKGGIKTSDPGTIYWIKDLSLEVRKKVVSENDVDKLENFEFYVELTGEATDGSGTKAEDISGTYGSITFNKGRGRHFKLRDGESRTADDLPQGIGYNVFEILTTSQSEKYTTKTEKSDDTYQTGTIGENINDPDESKRYVSLALFTNTRISGTRKVIIRKVMATDYRPLTDAKINIYLKNSISPYISANSMAKSVSSGVIWIGDLPYGDYVVEETDFPNGVDRNKKWFYIIADEDGVIYPDTGYISREDAVRALERAR